MTPTPPVRPPPCGRGFASPSSARCLSAPPARGALKTAIRRPGRQDLDASRHRTRRPVLGRHHRAVVLHGTARPRRPRRRPAPRRPQGLRQGVPRHGPGRAALSPVPRPPALELPTPLRQPRRAGEGRACARAAALVCHGPALHAGARLGAQAEAAARTNAPAKHVPRSDARRARSAATKPSTSESSGISISTTDRSRCSLPAASGCARSRWASSMTTRGSAATSSGTSRRPPRTWCTGSPRRSRSAACPVPS